VALKRTSSSRAARRKSISRAGEGKRSGVTPPVLALANAPASRNGIHGPCLMPRDHTSRLIPPPGEVFPFAIAIAEGEIVRALRRWQRRGERLDP
jgi:hypothetical protein